MSKDEARCPYCVVDGKFHAMTVLPNGTIDMQQLRAHHFPQRQGFQMSLLEVPRNEFLSQISPNPVTVVAWRLGIVDRR